MTTLKQAREQGKINQFIKEREGEAKADGNADTFNRTVTSMARKSPEAPRASSRRSRGD